MTTTQMMDAGTGIIADHVRPDNCVWPELSAHVLLQSMVVLCLMQASVSNVTRWVKHPDVAAQACAAQPGRSRVQWFATWFHIRRKSAATERRCGGPRHRLVVKVPRSRRWRDRPRPHPSHRRHPAPRRTRGHLRVIDCTADVIERWQLDWQSAGRSNATVNRRGKHLRDLFASFACDHGVRAPSAGSGNAYRRAERLVVRVGEALPQDAAGDPARTDEAQSVARRPGLACAARGGQSMGEP
jgi:hypothetical protein